MDRYTLILVADERSPVRRFQVPKIYVRRALYGAVGLGLIFMLCTWDYWRKRADNAELADLRVQAAEQQQQIEAFKATMVGYENQISRVRELERKVRIIANLPGASGVGGDEVTEYVSPTGAGGGHRGAPPHEADAALPAGVPEELEVDSHDVGAHRLDVPKSHLDGEQAEVLGVTTDGARLVHDLGRLAIDMEGVAGAQGDALEELIGQLDEKRVKLSSMPSVWPARGWITSRFGPRVSPFTGRHQHHAGIDIAASRGTPIIAPARARVSYVGRKGPLGNTLVLDHGFGVKTLYGHTHEIHVKAGQEVDRGQEIASIGSSGRSTGPHLHYVVQVDGKPRNPLDYIFD